MITINNKSRDFSASEDMFPTMERNFAWLFGMQTPEQGWKTVLAITIMYRAQGSAEEERQYGFPVGRSFPQKLLRPILLRSARPS